MNPNNHSSNRNIQKPLTNKVWTLLMCFIFSFFSIANAQQISLAEIIPVSPSTGTPAVVKADSKGGTMQFKRTYRKGCEGNYYIRWTFSKDITQLKKDEEFTVNIECVSCTSPCGYKWTSATAGGANNIIKPVGKYSFEYNGNIKVKSSEGRVHNWYPGHLSHKTVMTVPMTKSVPHTAFYINMGSHRVYYIYKEGAPETKDINCHTLFGLGKLVASLEIGAMEGYGKEWMINTIDYALNHIKASNCLSPDYLTDLKKRILASTTGTKSFYTEIQAYSLSLNTEVETSCACCSSCKQ